MVVILEKATIFREGVTFKYVNLDTPKTFSITCAQSRCLAMAYRAMLELHAPEHLIFLSALAIGPQVHTSHLEALCSPCLFFLKCSSILPRLLTIQGMGGCPLTAGRCVERAY